MENILKRYPDRRVRALVVWEPILPTDIVRPLPNALGRVRDARAVQIWDPGQLIAKQMKRDITAQPDCCEEEGILWDLIAIYPPGAAWTDRMPPPVFLNGTVVDQEQAASAKLR